MKGRAQHRHGFTIVELLIVIVVIGILAAITIVAFNGVQEKARAAAIQSDVSSAIKTLESFRATSPTSSYPANLTEAALRVSNGNVATYTPYSSNTGYCVHITHTGSSTSYYVTGGGNAKEGTCESITNLVLTPRSPNFNPLSSDVTKVSNVSWNGKSTWNRYTFSGSGNATSRMYLNLSDLTNGQAYTTSFLVGNTASSAVSFALDFSDQNAAVFTLEAGEQRRISFVGSRVTYDSVYRFVDMSLSGVSSSILIADGIIAAGTTARTFADGSSLNWVWNGTANSSTSIGPAL